MRVPLWNVRKFILCERPIRTAEWFEASLKVAH